MKGTRIYNTATKSRKLSLVVDESIKKKLSGNFENFLNQREMITVGGSQNIKETLVFPYQRRSLGEVRIKLLFTETSIN